MPFNAHYMSWQEYDPAAQASPGGGANGAPGSAPQPPPGQTNVMTRRRVQVKWQFKEPEPGGACTGFEVAVFAGDGVDGGVLALPVEFVDDPAARSHVFLLELRTQVALRSAVRACYGAARSDWRTAAGTGTFVPDTAAV